MKNVARTVRPIHRGAARAIFAYRAKLLACPLILFVTACEPSVRLAAHYHERTVQADDSRWSTRLVLLGTGTPNCEPDRWGASVAVVADGVAYLVDCGPGVVRRAAAVHTKRGISGLAPERLEYVFITHLHSDHTLGLADLILSPWTLGRSEPLKVFGPPGTAAMCEHLRAAYSEDIRIRLDGLEPTNATGHQVVVTEVSPGEVYRDERVRVTAIAVRHGSWNHAYGYQFETADRRIVISGDTAPCQELMRFAIRCDTLVHEVYSDAGFAAKPPAWQRYHAAFHTSAGELASLAAMARPKLLVLYHQLLWGTTPDDLLKEIRRGYGGVVACGDDLDVY